MRAGRASLCKPAIAQPQHKSQKPAFLVPFEVFYDALTYARTLKGWPHEPPQKSAALTQAPQRQQEHVAAMVERWLGPSLPMIQIFCRSTPSVSHNHTLSRGLDVDEDHLPAIRDALARTPELRALVRAVCVHAVVDKSTSTAPRPPRLGQGLCGATPVELEPYLDLTRVQSWSFDVQGDLDVVDFPPVRALWTLNTFMSRLVHRPQEPSA
ncbi:uncharacterized protein BXZ73DRAFT_102543 [Epithele typhae]|uniref:uncharacterized protein n=1 Tax=Epithele typhae TaxID=378194 RepID=UPI002008EABB|nr:uncharacterized protein BXZ73DRAFT_102543 [Epithele typhae]KAH9928038.1 hypothetical protein BXZ73DRAFT_102543 [Epithele typhae]